MDGLAKRDSPFDPGSLKLFGELMHLVAFTSGLRLLAAFGQSSFFLRVKGGTLAEVEEIHGLACPPQPNLALQFSRATS